MVDWLGQIADSGADSKLANWLLPAGIALIILWLMWRLRHRRRHRKPTPSAREQVEGQRQAQGVRNDLSQVMVEVEELAKRFGAQLDAKAVRLEKLISDADVRITELKRRQGDDSPPETSAAEQLGTGAEALEVDSSQPPDLFQHPGARSVGAAAGDMSGSLQSTDDPLAKSVHQLADAGNSAIEIARTLNEHVGKVELILALRESADKPQSPMPRTDVTG